MKYLLTLLALTISLHCLSAADLSAQKKVLKKQRLAELTEKYTQQLKFHPRRPKAECDSIILRCVNADYLLTFGDPKKPQAINACLSAQESLQKYTKPAAVFPIKEENGTINRARALTMELSNKFVLIPWDREIFSQVLPLTDEDVQDIDGEEFESILNRKVAKTEWIHTNIFLAQQHFTFPMHSKELIATEANKELQYIGLRIKGPNKLKYRNIASQLQTALHIKFLHNKPIISAPERASLPQSLQELCARFDNLAAHEKEDEKDSQ